MKRFGMILTGMLVLVSSGYAAAGVVVTLGDQDFNDGDMLSPGAYVTPQAGEPAPFDTAYGVDDQIGPSFDKIWTFSYPAVVDPILSASLTIGVWDHDSNAEPTGGLGTLQVNSYVIDGNDLTGDLNTAFEAHGGSIGTFVSEYNTYTLPLPSSSFADLADGSAAVRLMLQNGVSGFPGSQVIESYNGAGVDFSTLEITTVPEPGTLGLLAVLVALGVGRYWRRR